MSNVVVITGASAGVGRATAQAFARKHAKIVLLARGREGLEGAKRDVEELGGQALIVQTDVSDASQIERAADLAEEKFGPIDVWVNNAMVSVFSPVSEMRAEEYQRVTNVTYLGFVYGTLAALRRMRQRNRGVIVQVGSALAYRSIPLQSAYCGAKHAMVGFTDSLRCELFHNKSHIHLTVVHMPALNTPQFEWSRSRMPRRAQPVPPIFQPEVAARAIVYAARRHPRELWVGTPTIMAITSNRIAPGLLDRYLGRTGYKAQQGSEPTAPHRDNLFEPVPRDFGAHGRFDERARWSSRELWTRTRLPQLLLTGLGVVGVVVLGRKVFEVRRPRRNLTAA